MPTTEPDWSESVYLENEAERRFVRLVQDGTRSVVSYGATGTPGKQREHTHADAAAAARWGRRAAARLRHKGYRLGPCRAGMVEAIQQAPESMDARRAYASWLLQHGDPRGELISLGLQLLTAEASAAHQQAFDALLARHPETLDVTALARSTHQHWEGGFVRAGVVDVSVPAGKRDPDAGARLRRYLSHPSLAVVQRLAVFGYFTPFEHIIVDAAPRSLREVKLYEGPIPVWTRGRTPDPNELLARWAQRFPSLRSVECHGPAPVVELEDEPPPRGALATLLWWLGF